MILGPIILSQVSIGAGMRQSLFFLASIIEAMCLFFISVNYRRRPASQLDCCKLLLTLILFAFVGKCCIDLYLMGEEVIPSLKFWIQCEHCHGKKKRGVAMLWCCPTLPHWYETMEKHHCWLRTMAFGPKGQRVVSTVPSGQKIDLEWSRNSDTGWKMPKKDEIASKQIPNGIIFYSAPAV